MHPFNVVISFSILAYKHTWTKVNTSVHFHLMIQEEEYAVATKDLMVGN